MFAIRHIMAHTTDQIVCLVYRSFSHSEKLCMGPSPPKLTQVPQETGVSMGLTHGHKVPEKVRPPWRGQCQASLAGVPPLQLR